MSSLARRSMRTTAAAAGIAAIGVGFAGPALAAPDLPPALPGLDMLGAPSPSGNGTETGTGTGTGTGTPQNSMTGELPGIGNQLSGMMSDLPQVFSFEGPSIYTTTPMAEAGPENAPTGLPELAQLTELAGLPGAGLPTTTDAAPVAPAASPGADSQESGAGGGESVGRVNAPVDPESLIGANQVGALPSMDTATMMAELARKALAGEALAAGNAIG